MAIGVLEGKEQHSYYHNLESFYYLLIWVCTKYHQDLKPSEDRPQNPFSAWGSFDRATDNKTVLTYHEPRFEELLSLFKGPFEIVKSLVRQLQSILPSSTVSRRRPEDDITTYQQVIDAFSQHITSCADHPGVG